MSRVLVDLLFFTGTKGGMESYAREVYSRLSPDERIGPKFAGECTRSAPWRSAARATEKSSPRAQATRSSPLIPASTTRPGNQDVSVAASSDEA